jgi:hypothetical protein
MALDAGGREGVVRGHHGEGILAGPGVTLM